MLLFCAAITHFTKVEDISTLNRLCGTLAPFFYNGNKSITSSFFLVVFLISMCENEFSKKEG